MEDVSWQISSVLYLCLSKWLRLSFCCNALVKQTYARKSFLKNKKTHSFLFHTASDLKVKKPLLMEYWIRSSSQRNAFLIHYFCLLRGFEGQQLALDNTKEVLRMLWKLHCTCVLFIHNTECNKRGPVVLCYIIFARYYTGPSNEVHE